MAAKEAGEWVEGANRVVCIWKNCFNKERKADSLTVGSKVSKVATAARWKSGTENPEIWRPGMATVAASIDSRSKKINSYCSSEPT